MRTFVTTRYDRVIRNGVWHRLHQEDLCQALAVPPSKKYQRVDGGPGVAAFADLLQAMPVLEDRPLAAVAFFGGFVFNAVVAGTDAHAKNYSLMLDGERVRFAPLYDLATYAPYAVAGESIQLPMNVNGKYRLNAISTDDLLKMGAKLRIPRAEALDIVDQLRDGTAAAFAQARDELLSSGPDAERMADEVVSTVKRLPLVRLP